MTAGLADLGYCVHLAADAVVLQRVYELGDLRRLQDLIADGSGTVSAAFGHRECGLRLRQCCGGSCRCLGGGGGNT